MKKKAFYIMSILVVITILLMSLIIRKDVELTLWTDNSNKKEIINYVKDISNRNSKNYIPEEDRIAVFDLDGTLYCETDPVYLSFKMYADKVHNESLDISEKILKKELSLNDETKYLAYKDMTIVEYEEYINDFISGDEEGYTFDGWYTDSSYSNKLDFDSSVDSDLTLYAKWKYGI